MASGWRGALRGLFHAHVGWMFRGVDRASPERYAKDLLADPVLRAIDRTFPLWVLVGLAFPFGLGLALTGTVVGGLTGLLWGGAVRILFLHHATFSINSLCHFFGRRRFRTGDDSRNLALAGAADLRRGLAQQPPRLSHLRPPRAHALAARSRRLADRQPRAPRSRLGRRADHPRRPAREALGLIAAQRPARVPGAPRCSRCEGSGIVARRRFHQREGSCRACTTT